jgi:putative membrane protein
VQALDLVTHQSVRSQGGSAMMGGYHMMGGMGGGMLLIVVFWIAVIALIFWGLISMSRIRRKVFEPDPLEILKQRFARGEINREEFEQARKLLSSTAPVPEHHDSQLTLR